MQKSPATYLAASIIMIIISTISLICSLVCLRVIKLINIKNSYLKSIGRLAGYTAWYEICNIFIAFIPTFADAPSTSTKSFGEYLSALRFFYVFISLSTAVVTLTMSVYTYCTIISKAYDPLIFIRSLNKYRISLVPLIIAIIVAINEENRIVCIVYYSLRYAIILTNLLVYLLITNALWDMSDKTSKSLKTDPLLVFAQRLKYYPLIQVGCASGSFLMLVIYHSLYYFPVPHSTTNFGSFLYIYYAISNSMSGILYFIVFLIFQPTAYQYFKINWIKILLFYPKEKCDNLILQKAVKNNTHIRSIYGMSSNGISSGTNSINPNIVLINSSRNTADIENRNNGDISGFTRSTEHDFALCHDDEIDAFILGPTSISDGKSTSNNDIIPNHHNFSFDINHEKAHNSENRQSLYRKSLDYINSTFSNGRKTDANDVPDVVNSLHEIS